MDLTKETIKALSWKEPYGTLMLYGKIETRIWRTNYRGLVLICASKKSYCIDDVLDISPSGFMDIWNIFKIDPNDFNWDSYNLFKRAGKAFAIGNLVDCRPMKPEDEEKAFVKYYPDLYSWIFEDVKAIQSFPWKGSLGMRFLTQEEKQKIILI